jgi:hypothetical protein
MKNENMNGTYVLNSNTAYLFYKSGGSSVYWTKATVSGNKVTRYDNMNDAIKYDFTKQ